MGRPLVAVDSPVGPFQHQDNVVPLEVLKAVGVIHRGGATGLPDWKQHFIYGDLG